MIVFRYIFKETLKTQLAILFVLLLIFMSQNFVRVLSRAVRGAIPTQLVTDLLLLNIPNMALLMLPISLFIGVLFAHGRLYAESEMTVLKAVGVGPRYIMNITLLLALLTGILSTINSFWVAPWAREQQYQLLERAKKDPSFTALEEGRFLSLDDGRLVAYVDKLEDKGTGLSRVFVLRRGSDKAGPTVVVAESGRLTTDENGLRWVTLRNGHRYAAPLTGQAFQISSFEEYRAWVPLGKDEDPLKRDLDTLPIGRLLQSDDPKAMLELQWRLSQPFAILVLTLIVVPLAVVNPRQGRYAKLLPAIMLYLSYFLLLSAARSAMDRGGLPAFPGLFAVPVFYLVVLGLPLNVGSTKLWNYLRLRLKGGHC